MSDTPEPGQLVLPVGLRDEATFDNFLVDARYQPLVDAVRGQHRAGGQQAVYLHGPSGAGKSHLLEAAAHADGHHSLYLPLSQLRDFDPGDVLQGADALRRLCIDDLQAVCGETRWEEALFHLFNAARANGTALLLSADAAPRQLALALEDLRSRLSWGVVYALREPTDDVKAEILTLRGQARGMTLSPGVAAFMVSRAPRGTKQLLALLDQLADASLVRKRPVSIPFVKEVFGW